MKITPLRDVIESRLDQRWEEFAAAHPSLAAAIDRTRLLDNAVQSMRDDPEFQALLTGADLDEAKLAAAAKAVAIIEKLLTRALALSSG